MTIATLALYRGLAEGISQAHSVRGYPEWFYFLGPGRRLRRADATLDPASSSSSSAGVALDRTTFGRTLYAIGSNETAARFSALPVDRVKLAVYTLSGLASAVSPPVVLVSRVTTTRMDMGMGYELDVIAAVVLGGTSIFGGSGTIWGTVIGLVMIQLLKNGSGADGGQGRRDDHGDRRGAHFLGAHRELPSAPPRLGDRSRAYAANLAAKQGRKRT